MGLWRPSTEHAYAIRERIAADPAGWKRAAHGKKFADLYGALEGESLKRPPRGFDPDHPLIEDLKRKDFIASTRLRQSDITKDGFMDAYLATVKTGTPLMRYLCEAIGVGF